MNKHYRTYFLNDTRKNCKIEHGISTFLPPCFSHFRMMFWERGTHACLAADIYQRKAGIRRKEKWMEEKPESDDPLIHPEFWKSTDHKRTARSNTNNSWARATVEAHGPRATRATTKATVSVSIRFRPGGTTGWPGAWPPARQGSHVATDCVAPSPSRRNGHVRCGAARWPCLVLYVSKNFHPSHRIFVHIH